MKIVFVIPTLQGNGAERVVLNLYRGFWKYKKAECHIICFRKRIDWSLEKNINLHFLTLPGKNIVNSLFHKRRCAKVIDKYIKEKIGYPDAVFSNLTEADKIMKYSRLPVFHIIHSTTSEEHWGRRNELRKIIARYKIQNIYTRHPAICVSEGVLNDFRKNVSRVTSFCIYNPVNQEYIEKRAEEKIPDYELKNTGNYIINVGKLNQAKNHELLIRAYAASAIKENLLILGTDGGKLGSCRELAKSLSIENRVILGGFKANPFPYIKQAKLMVLSSDFEGFPLVLTEAAALGVPFISTDCPNGPAEIAGPSYKHCLTPVKDTKAMAETIKLALANPKKYTPPLQDQFKIENVINKYYEVINIYANLHLIK